MKTKLSKILLTIMFTLLVFAGGGIFGACANSEAKVNSKTPTEPSVVYADVLPLEVDGETLLKYTGEKNAAVDIPSSYDIDQNGNIVAGDTYKITKIADGAFKNVEFYDAYIDMSNVTVVGESAFENAKNITIGEMPSLREVKDKAFYNSNINFKSLDMGKVSNFGKYAFSKVSGYKVPQNSTVASLYADVIDTSLSPDITIGCNNGITIVESGAFAEANINNVTVGKGIVYFNSSGSTAGTFEDSTINQITFEGGSYQFCIAMFKNSNLSSFNFEGNIMDCKIPSMCFGRCLSLTHITIPNGVTIVSNACDYSTELVAINLPASVQTFPAITICEGCTKLTKITRDATEATSGGVINFNFAPEVNCKATTFHVPQYVTQIAEGAFRGFNKLTKLLLPFVGASTTAQTTTKYGLFGYIFGTQQFDGSTLTDQEYESYYIPNTLTTVDVYAGDELKAYSFCNCTHLTNVTIADTHTKIRGSSFYNCSSLVKFTIPEGVTIVGSNVFNGCTNLVALNIPSTITTSNDYENYWTTALDNCPKLTKVTRSTTEATSGGVINLQFAAETACGVKKFTVPDSVTQIAAGAFANFGALEELIIPFVGTSSAGYSTGTFGVIFGTNSYSGWISVGLTGQFHVPSTLKTVNVTSAQYLPGYAFANCSMLTSISVDGTYTTIESYAFADCTGISSFALPATVTSISDHAFQNCSNANFKSIELPNGLVTIGHSAFSGCSNLEAINIPGSITSIGSSAFDGCSKLKSVTRSETAVTSGGVMNFRFASSVLCSIEELNIPSSVTSISASAFRGFNCLESLTVPFIGTSLTVAVDNSNGYGCFGSIFGDTSFTDATGTDQGYHTWHIPDSLTNVSILNSRAAMPNNAFRNCTHLTNISLGSGTSWTSIGNYAFYSCTSLTTLTISTNNITNVGEYAFYNCSKLSGIAVPSKTTSMGQYAFYGCSMIVSVTIPSSATTIGDYAFANCGGLTSVEFLSGRTSISSAYMFRACSGLRVVTLPSSGLESIYGSSMFYGCTGLYNIEIPNTVKTLGGYLFAYSSLKCVTIPSSVTKIDGNNLFYNCASLEAVNIPGTISSGLGYSNMFAGCTKLTKTCQNSTPQTSGGYINFMTTNTSATSVYLSIYVTEIGDGTFYNWTSLQTVGNVSSITNIGNAAFANCTSLKSDWISNMTKLKEIGSDMYGGTFKNCSSSNFTTVTLPSGFLYLHDASFSGCTNLNCVEVPSSTVILGDCSYVEDPFDGTDMYETNFHRGEGYSSGLVFNFDSSTVSMITTLNLAHFKGDTYMSYGVLENFRNVNRIKLKYLDQGYGKGSYCTFASLFGNSSSSSFTRVYNDFYVPNSLRHIEASTTTSTFCGGLKGCSMITDFVYRGPWVAGMCNGCTNLKNLTIYADVSSTIPDYEFKEHSNLTTVNFHNSNSTNAITTGIDSFYNCPKIQSVSLTGVGTLGNGTFHGNSALTSITWGSKLTTIGAYAFENCTKIAKVTLPSSVTKIGRGAFGGCSAMTQFTFSGNSLNHKWQYNDTAGHQTTFPTSGFYDYGTGNGVYDYSIEYRANYMKSYDYWAEYWWQRVNK